MHLCKEKISNVSLELRLFLQTLPSGGDKDCDHWHDSAGFAISHVAISLMFEQALQAVDLSIALPYWDFTIEGTKYDWTSFRGSSVFSDDWFGTAAPRNVRQPDINPVFHSSRKQAARSISIPRALNRRVDRRVVQSVTT